MLTVENKEEIKRLILEQLAKHFQSPAEEEYLSEEQAAQMLSLEKKTLAKWRFTRRNGPPFLMLGRKPRYRRSDLRIWIEECLVLPKK